MLCTSVPQIDKELTESLHIYLPSACRPAGSNTYTTQVIARCVLYPIAKQEKKNAHIFLITLLVVAYIGGSAHAGSQMVES